MLATMKNVVKRYGNFMALDHLDLNVAEGEILGLLGPNGAGKTTAIRSLCGLIGFDSGDINVFGQKQHVNNLEIKRRMGIVTQEITVFQDLNAIENLRYFGALYGLRGSELESNVARVLEFIGLTDRAKKRPKTFSGGMQRRLNIGCALVHRPKLLIMDEPTVGIDPQSRNHILESVRTIAGEGTTVIYTTHYMEEVEAVCNRIAIMDSGRVIAEGTKDELVSKIHHEDNIKMTANMASDGLTADIKAIAGVKDVVVNGNDYVITSSAESGNVNRIMEIAMRHGGIANITAAKPNLEDVFLTLTGKCLRDGDE
ncbi:MAG: ABC transporter ATP-binding protein [Defluviitaleaceae bacterium]|nr:ABC transporter ATP-binding protein [Defluviitaleaceae bacterium]MCL2275083.1 ABC transporter ATP-binding protein [Defluviitaleaceae bacterium]